MNLLVYHYKMHLSFSSLYVHIYVVSNGPLILILKLSCNSPTLYVHVQYFKTLWYHNPYMSAYTHRALVAATVAAVSSHLTH